MDKEVMQCVIQAERFLALREHNVKELKDKLTNRKYSESTITKTIEYLQENDELNEERYVRAFVRSNNARHPENRNIMMVRLLQKGTDKQVAKEVLDSVYTEEYVNQLAKQCLDKNIKKSTDALKIKQKMVKSGFSLGQADNLLQEVSFGYNEDGDAYEGQ